MRTEWIGDLRRLDELAEPWDRLAEHDPSPFSRHVWFAAWWRAFGEGRRVEVCVIWDGDELVAALPLMRRRRALAALANSETPAFRPLASGDAPRAALAAAVAAHRATLELAALPAREPTSQALIDDLEREGMRAHLDADFVSPLVDTAESFEAYRERFRPRWRELERRGRKLRREHQVDTALIEAPADLEDELEEGLRLEAAGWKGSGGTAILSDPTTASFYREVAHASHDRDELRFSSLRVDGRLAAFDLAILDRGRYFLLKTAFDEELRRAAPGLVLRRAVVERCFELELTAHEFLGGDMEWKRVFATGEREHFVLRAYPRGPAGALRVAYRGRLRPLLRSAYRRVRPPK